MREKTVNIGDRFGYLEVIGVKNKHWRGNSWLCKCVCGKEIVLYTSHLTGIKNRRPTKSCGCKQKKQNGKTMTNIRIYNIWHNMNVRCYDETNHTYPRYGGKGIKVCDEWKNDFESFFEWAMSNGYKNTLTIDRIDSAKGYSPENCRWSDYYVQNQNKGVSKDNKTGVTGVYKRKNGYKADIVRNKFSLYLGVYKTLGEAKEARLKAEEHFKEHGTLENYKKTPS